MARKRQRCQGKKIGNMENTNARFLSCGATAVRNLVTAPCSDSCRCCVAHPVFRVFPFCPSPLQPPYSYRSTDMESHRLLGVPVRAVLQRPL